MIVLPIYRSDILSVLACGLTVIAVMTVAGVYREAWAQVPVPPHQALPFGPINGGPSPSVAPSVLSAVPEELERVSPQIKCELQSSQPKSDCRTDDRLAATALRKTCDPEAADGRARHGAYAPRHADIALVRRHGTFQVEGIVNACLVIQFHLDSGAADVTLSSDQFERLRMAGAVFPLEIAGRERYVMADGRVSDQAFFTLRSLQIGPMIVRNVRAAIMPGDAPALLGMGFLGRFYSWSVNNHRQILSLNSGSLPATRP